MISGLVLKYLKETGLVMTKRYETALPRSSEVILTKPFQQCQSQGLKEGYRAKLV